MSLAGALLRFSAGTVMGFVGAFALMPEVMWPGFYQYCFVPVKTSVHTLSFWWTYYKPSAVRLRRMQEILEEREALLKPVYVPESPAEMRRKVKFMSDINYEIRKAETLASVQGVYKREREEIIYNLMRKHYPELFADGPELVKEELERKRAELQGKVHARLPNAPVPKHDGIV